MNVMDLNFWAGTEQALAGYLSALKRMADSGVNEPAKGAWHDSADPQYSAQRAPRLFSRQGNVAVISIAGPLNNTDSWRNEYMGATGYPEIRAALIYAAKDAETKAVVLDIKSGGGAVSGVTDTADLIAMIDTKVKPVHAFSDGMVASAAYWIGASARSLDIGRVTEAGSIGVLMVHQDLSKMYAEMGITNTVIRSGKYKALGNSVETLSDTAKEEFQAQIDQMAGMFTQHVADRRGVSYAQADQKMGQGRVFVGQSAVDAGLVDSITSFDALMSKIQGGIDSEKQPSKYGANLQKGSDVKNALTEQEIAALALGANIGGGSGDAPAKTEAELAADVASKAEADAAADDAKAVPGNATATLVDPSAAVVEMLQSQLAAATDKLVALTVDKQGLAAANAALQAQTAAMRPVVQKTVSTLRVALGGSAAGVDTMSDDTLVAEYANLSATFGTKFKSGGVAVSSASADKSVEVADPVRLARIASTRPAK